MNIWTEMYRGMGYAAVVVGFVMMLGICLAALYGVWYAVLALLKSDDPDGEVTGDGGETDPYDAGWASPDGPHANAGRVGRHVKKGA